MLDQAFSTKVLGTLGFFKRPLGVSREIMIYIYISKEWPNKKPPTSNPRLTHWCVWTLCKQEDEQSLSQEVRSEPSQAEEWARTGIADGGECTREMPPGPPCQDSLPACQFTSLLFWKYSALGDSISKGIQEI